MQRTIILLTMAGWTLGCNPSIDDTAGDDIETPDYSVDGTYTPGTLESEMVGSTGETISLQVWYPSTDEPGDGVRYDALWNGAATEGLTTDCAQTRPVLVFGVEYDGKVHF